MTIKKELAALKKDITAIGKKMEKLVMAYEKSETRVAKASKPKAVKASPAKKAPNAPAKIKAVKLTATDQVLKIINRSKRGVDTATLMIKTGFDRKKVTNIIHRTFKQDKIKKTERGVYVGVK